MPLPDRAPPTEIPMCLHTCRVLKSNISGWASLTDFPTANHWDFIKLASGKRLARLDVSVSGTFNEGSPPVPTAASGSTVARNALVATPSHAAVMSDGLFGGGELVSFEMVMAGILDHDFHADFMLRRDFRADETKISTPHFSGFHLYVDCVSATPETHTVVLSFDPADIAAAGGDWVDTFDFLGAMIPYVIQTGPDCVSTDAVSVALTLL